MVDSAIQLLDKFAALAREFGVGSAVGTLALGAVMWWLGKDALPTVWRWFQPHADEVLDLYKLKLRRDLEPAPTANNSAELIARAAGEAH